MIADDTLFLADGSGLCFVFRVGFLRHRLFLVLAVRKLAWIAILLETSSRLLSFAAVETLA